jgi:hypothetical protein
MATQASELLEDPRYTPVARIPCQPHFQPNIAGFSGEGYKRYKRSHHAIKILLYIACEVKSIPENDLYPQA